MIQRWCPGPESRHDERAEEEDTRGTALAWEEA